MVWLTILPCYVHSGMVEYKQGIYCGVLISIYYLVLFRAVMDTSVYLTYLDILIRK
jgi:hypothetical protein